MQFIKRNILVLILLVFTVLPASAGVGQIVTDFKPLSGYIVMDMQGEYIIDLDASHSVRVGDIFAAVATGEKITHPVTGEVLGTLDEVRAQMRVSKVKTGYSYAVPLPGSSKLKAGEAIVRFQGIPARFWDYSGEGESFYTELKAGLPALDWVSYADAQAQKPERPGKIEGLEGLLFVLTGRGLEVRDATFQQTRFYSRADLAKEGIEIATARPAVAAPSAVVKVAPKGNTGIQAAVQTVKPGSTGIVTTAAQSASEGIWFGPEMTGEMVGLETIDFDGDGVAGLAIAFPHKIMLADLTGGEYSGNGFIDIPKRLRVTGVDAADLDNNGRQELYITALKPSSVDSATEKLASMVVEQVDGQLHIIADDVPFFLSRADLPGEGRIIVAQRSDNLERTYAGPVFRLDRKGKKFRAGKALDIGNHKLTAHGFTSFEQDGQNMVALFDINEKLEVVNGAGERIWSGGEIMGGSQTYIAHPDPNVTAEMPVHHFLKARLVTMKDGTVLVPFNEGSSRTFYKREFGKSTLLAMKWDGYGLKEVWHTESQSGYLADYQVADVDRDGKDEIIMAIVFAQGGVLKKIRTRSSLVVYELDELGQL